MVLSLLCSACSGANVSRSVTLTEGLDPSVETVDQDCSYFYFMWGRTAELEEKFEEAREAYEKALVCDMHATHIMKRLAVLLINMDKKREAAAWMSRMIAEDPDDVSSYTLLANLYINMERFDKAESTYREVLARDPKDFNTMLMMGSLYSRQGKFGEAREVLENLVKVNPESFIGFHYLAKIYMEMKEYDKARKAFDKALELNWSPYLAIEAAYFLEKDGLDKDAAAIYRRVIADDEGNERVRSQLISLLLKMDKIEEAIAELKALRPFATDVLKIDLNIGRLLIDRKRYDEAIDLLQEALEADPQFYEARTLIALAYHEKGDTEKAIENLTDIEAEADNYEETTLFLAKVLAREKKYDAAIALLKERVADEKGRYKSFYVSMASLYRQQKNYAEAEKTFQVVMRLYPDDPDLFFEYGLYLDGRGQTDKALEYMEKVLALKEDDPYALNYIGYTWAEQGKNLDKSLEYLTRAVKQKPDDGFIKDSLGWVLFRMGRLDEAVSEIEKALEIEPDDPTINEHLGDVYYRAGKAGKALKAWEKALSLHSDGDKKEKVRKKIEDARK